MKDTFGSSRLLLFPSQIPPFDQVQKLFFHTAHNDELGSVTSITAYFQEGAIIGLAFSYKSKKTGMIGSPADSHQRVQVNDESRIVRFSVTISEKIVTEIEV